MLSSTVSFIWSLISHCFRLISLLCFKWPAFLILSFIIFIELIFYFLLRYIIYSFEFLFRLCRQHRKLRRKVRYCEGINSYEEWKQSAKLLDRYDGREAWKVEANDQNYNYKLIQKLVYDLHHTRLQIIEVLHQNPNHQEVSINTIAPNTPLDLAHSTQFPAPSLFHSPTSPLTSSSSTPIQSTPNPPPSNPMSPTTQVIQEIEKDINQDPLIVDHYDVDLSTIVPDGITIQNHLSLDHDHNDAIADIVAGVIEGDNFNITISTTDDDLIDDDEEETDHYDIHYAPNQHNNQKKRRNTRLLDSINNHIHNNNPESNQATKSQQQQQQRSQQHQHSPLLQPDLTLPLTPHQSNTAQLLPSDRIKQPIQNETDLNALTYRLIHLIQLALRQNVALLNEELYSHTNVGTKYLITTFTKEITNAISILSQIPQNPQQKLELYLGLSKYYGQNALCFSGGAGFCNFHFGLVRSLVGEFQDIFKTFKIFSGTSSGSMIAAHICCRTDEELQHGFLPEELVKYMGFDNGQSHLDKIKSLFNNGFLIDSSLWIDLLRYHCCGDMTFLEAYEKTGRVLVISASSSNNEPPFFFSYLTSPHCIIRSACVQSASIPLLLPSVPLLFKDPITKKITSDTSSRFRDGSFSADIPNLELAYYFNTSFYCVSQVNPHLIPFLQFGRNGLSSRSSARWGSSEFRGTFFFSFFESWLKYDMIKNLQIMKSMKLFPSIRFFGDVSSIFLQNFSGPSNSNVCMVPDSNFSDYLNLLNAPTVEDLTRMMKNGQMMLYFKMSMLENRCAISAAIIDGITQSEKVLRDQVAAALTTTTPPNTSNSNPVLQKS